MDLLLALGIDKQKAKFALSEFSDNVEIAADWCLEGDGVNWTPANLLSEHTSVVATRTESPPLSTAAYMYSDEQSRILQAKSVPPHRKIKPGAKVLIITKANQPTGKMDEGVVDQVLTRSDHPRGVKVRLVDGRVGRCQKLV